MAYQALLNLVPTSWNSLQISLPIVCNASVTPLSCFMIQQAKHIPVFKALDLFSLPRALFSQQGPCSQHKVHCNIHGT